MSWKLEIFDCEKMGVSSWMMLKALGRSKNPYVEENEGELQISEKAVAFYIKPRSLVAYAVRLSAA